MSELVQEIRGYIKSLDSELALSDNQIKMMINRVRVYLNRKDIPSILISVIAEIIVEKSDMAKKNAEENVSQISDNGQTITFSNRVYQNLISSSDADLFASHTAILNRFRKVGVIGVNPFKDD